MTDPKVHEVAAKLGQFYLNKNGGDYDKAADEIYRLHIASTRTPHKPSAKKDNNQNNTVEQTTVLFLSKSFSKPADTR